MNSKFKFDHPHLSNYRNIPLVNAFGAMWQSQKEQHHAVRRNLDTKR